jgi:hypothetical protein
MDTMEIPAGTLAGKTVVVACCLLIVVGVLAWGVPKFWEFLNVVLGRAPRKPGTKNIHLVLGFFVYGLIFAPVFIAAMIGASVATAGPTLLSSEGIVGRELDCGSDLGVFSFSCSSPLGRSDSRKIILWNEIDKVDCISRRDGTIRELHVDSGSRQIVIGSLGVYNLHSAHQFIAARAPKGAVKACHVPRGRNQ